MPVAARPPRIVLAYHDRTGSSDDGVVSWLREKYGADVIAVTVDLGAGRALEAVRDRALAEGAARAHVMDVRDEFARDFVLPALRAGALSDLGALGCPLVARQLVTIAGMEHAGSVAFGGSEGAPLNRMVQALNGALDTILVATGQDSGARSVSARHTAEVSPEPAFLDIAFDRGRPVSLNGIAMPLVELMGSVGTIAAAHAVHAPVDVLQAAHRAVQRRATDADVTRVADHVAAEYASLVASGRWFTPLRSALDAFVDRIQEQVTGTARVRLHTGEWRLEP